ncbi:MAG TPA: oligosaccharide flippase family protein [Flavobacteriales bacterium]|nr:oligosaccharide flippase family protein [Flavobacteriales bacterium]
MRAFIWSFIGQFGNLTITIVGTIILSRILDPKDFGYMAMIMYWINLAQTVNNFGIHHIIVLNKEITMKELSSLFWFNMLLSLCFFSFFFFGAGIFGRFYKHDEVEMLSLILSFNFLLSAFLMVPQAMLHQQQKFRTQSIILLISTITGFCVSIWGTYITGSYLFLAVQQLVTVGTNFILHFLYFTWMPKFSLGMHYLKSNRKFAGNLFSVYFLEYIAQNMDTFIVGKVSTERITGLYSRASVFSILPVQNFTAAISKVLLPKIRDISPGTVVFNQLYIHYFKIILGTVSILMFFLISVDVYFIEFIFGKKWLPMRDYFDLFCLIGIFSSILSYIDLILLSTKKSAILLVFIIIEKTLLIVFLFCGYAFGIKGVLIAKLIFTFGIFIPKNVFMNKILKIPVMHLVMDTVKILSIPLTIGLLCFFIKQQLPEYSPAIILSLIFTLWAAGFMLFNHHIMNKFYTNIIRNIIKAKK